MRAILFVYASVFMFAACSDPPVPPPPPPLVTSFTPASGPWGTTVTLTGQDFGVMIGMSVIEFETGVGAAGFEIGTWHDAQITGRIKFPATGALSLRTHAGMTEVGTFTTDQSWLPSAQSFDVTNVAQEIVLSTGEVAALYDKYEGSTPGALVVFGGAGAGSFPLTALDEARLVETDDQSPAVIATKPDGTVVELHPHGLSLDAIASGITGDVVIAGRDVGGMYAWIDTSSGVERVRPSSSWTVDRGPYARAYSPLAGAVSADGTLWIAESEPGEYLSVQTLGPSAVAFGALERADATPYSDDIGVTQLLVASDGVGATVIAKSGTTSIASTRTAAATWSASPAVTGLVQYAYNATMLGAVINNTDAKSTSFVFDVANPADAELIPVWPMQSEGVAIDVAGQAHPLITDGVIAYALTPPPSI